MAIIDPTNGLVKAAMRNSSELLKDIFSIVYKTCFLDQSGSFDKLRWGIFNNSNDNTTLRVWIST
jgi:hypothetical protein